MGKNYLLIVLASIFSFGLVGCLEEKAPLRQGTPVGSAPASDIRSVTLSSNDPKNTESGSPSPPKSTTTTSLFASELLSIERQKACKVDESIKALL